MGVMWQGRSLLIFCGVWPSFDCACVMCPRFFGMKDRRTEHVLTHPSSGKAWRWCATKTRFCTNTNKSISFDDEGTAVHLPLLLICYLWESLINVYPNIVVGSQRIILILIFIRCQYHYQRCKLDSSAVPQENDFTLPWARSSSSW